ncbi:DUF3368 domain-containing protein [Gloeocapsa sp. PCC 73106]|uniref:DUF3368 domain-containing protein n=1 Tax=Gloeocapsa sp. PCC 73106 TaxID=102232 RepID=UPI0002ACBF84|nr:DUF3368 domain-containing protein [Gloeocapsa sp. PCC 73106]ELR97738.1 putative nucleic acid-binding protein [Gloeocapsa sp. PCC 73106]
MTNFPVINTSPLIFLTKGGYLKLLKVLNEVIIVPKAVADEIMAYGEEDITYQQLKQNSWLQITPIENIPSIIQNWDLGQGESEVLAYSYLNQRPECIIDDLAGRRCAIALKIPVRGTLGIVLLAKQKGEISKAKPIIQELRKTGMYLSDAVISKALSLVGE